MTVRRWDFRDDGTVGLKVETGVPPAEEGADAEARRAEVGLPRRAAPSCRVRLARVARMLDGFAAFAFHRDEKARLAACDWRFERRCRIESLLDKALAEKANEAAHRQRLLSDPNGQSTEATVAKYAWRAERARAALLLELDR